MGGLPERETEHLQKILEVTIAVMKVSVKGSVAICYW